MTALKRLGTAERLRWVVTPIVTFLALAAWAFASPMGAAPDDDYHLASIWCANGGSEYCGPGPAEDLRVMPAGFPELFCYVMEAEVSASCQDDALADWNDDGHVTRRGNFYGEYPPVYYGTMRLLAGDDLQSSAVTMRLFNAALFVGLATALAALLPAARRRTMLWGWLVTLVPLGMFLIPSNNPSGWAITGVGTAFVALMGWFETHGPRRWALGALYLLGVVMAAGARGDAGVYAALATGVVVFLTATRGHEWRLRSILPGGGLIIALALISTAGQVGTGTVGFSGGGNVTTDLTGGDAGADIPLSGLPLAAYNLLMLPFLWTGVWGSWALGWLDTMLPAIVPWAATAAFIVLAFAGLGQLSRRKAVVVLGLLAALVVIPVYVLTAGGNVVGENLQPRYLLPLIVLFAFALITEPAGRVLRFSRAQTLAILTALALANLVALQVNIRRYVTGVDQQGPNLDAGAEWWWSGVPIGPMGVWAVGAVAYALTLALLWRHLRNTESVAPAQAV